MRKELEQPEMGMSRPGGHSTQASGVTDGRWSHWTGGPTPGGLPRVAEITTPSLLLGQRDTAGMSLPLSPLCLAGPYPGSTNGSTAGDTARSHWAWQLRGEEEENGLRAQSRGPESSTGGRELSVLQSGACAAL